MRPQAAPLHEWHREALVGLRPVASASVRPRGEGFEPRLRLRRRVVAVRGGEDALVVAFGWKAGEVRFRVFARRAVSSADVERALEVGRAITAVDDDPSAFFAMVRRHPVLGPLARGVDPRLSRTPTVFESLTIAILEQLVTGFEARAAMRRLWRTAGELVPDTRLRAAPTARAVRRVPMWRLHEIGIGARRAVTLHASAARGDAIERLASHPPETFMQKLQSLPGIGPWTANAVARSALAHADAVPVGDFWAPFTISAALGSTRALSRDDMDGANAAMLEVLEPFRPERARVALVLERASLEDHRLPRIDPHRREPWKY